MRNILLFALIFILSCKVDVDWYEIGKRNLNSKNWSSAKKNFNYAIKENHIKKDSAKLFLKIIDSLELVDQAKEEKLAMEKINNRVINEIKLIEKLKKADTPNTMESIFIEIGSYETAWGYITDLKLYANDEFLNNAKALESTLKSTQIKRLPILRKEYGKLMNEKLWENNIDVSTSHSKYKTLNLTGGAFASNKNIKDMQTAIFDAVVKLRFKQVRYKWYKEDNEFQYYTIEVSNDNAPY